VKPMAMGKCLDTYVLEMGTFGTNPSQIVLG